MLLEKNRKNDNIQKALPKTKWQTLKKKHEQAISNIVYPYLQKKQHQHKDPVLDFLFEYYAFRPSYLKKWSPGIGVMLEDASSENFNSFDEMSFDENGFFLNPEVFPERRMKSARWILSLLENSLEKKPSFGCFGMHEWAMVYKAEKIRHKHLPLRLTPQDLTEFVESRPLVCTHFDAFRFFTDEAKPQNKFELNQQNFAETEQPGCLHTNMDLYKWAFKMYPWIGSEIIRKAFLLALETRKIDMRASPYDLRKLGLEPIKIETEDGRLEYVKLQKEIYQRSVTIREELIEKYKHLIKLIR